MNPKKQPKLRIEKDGFDRFIEILGWMALIVLVLLPIVYWNQLPQKIPTHFNAKGIPDAFGERGNLFLLPILGTLMYLGLGRLNKYTWIFNYPWKIRSQNMHANYLASTKMIRALATVIVITFAYIVFAKIQTALANWRGLGSWFIWIMQLGILLCFCYAFWSSYKYKKK